MSHPGQKFKAGGDERLAAYAINHLPSILLWIGQQWALAYLPNTSSTFFTYLRHPLRSPGSCIYTKKNQARARNVERIVYKNELNRSIPESSIQCLKGCRSKSRKAFDWNPPSFTFRYLILREAAK
ncbi:BnaA02g34740D [Brassica napus]|uniref:BnaA02g34740D protein n=1 Tax=Brassica napus TaxID=3708 RepID=A0A078IXS2_BRANA|nr:BnaA02g34740D [Brassica napus]